MRPFSFASAALFSFLVAATVFLAGCGGAADEKIGSDNVQDDNNAAVESAETTRQIFHYVPTPVESTSLLERAGAEYSFELLNKIEHVSLYETVSKKALNLGVYSTDLAYASIYEQPSEIMVFSACAQKLSDELGVTEAFTEQTIARIENNISDKDSILDIITETYYITDSHLKTSQRASLSALILAGAWMEGLHIATELAHNDPDNELLALRLMEQKFSLQNLLILAGQYKDDKKIAPVLADLKAVYALFDGVKEEIVAEASVSTNPETQHSTVQTGKQLTVDQATIAMLYEKVSAIRQGYVEP